MELWHAWACPQSMRVRAALAEKGVPYRSRELPPGATVPDLLGRNPRRSLPMLVDGTTVLAEPLAILEFLGKRWPEPPLIPSRPGREAVLAAYDRVNALFAPHLPSIDRGAPEERVQALGAVRQAMQELDAEVVAGAFLLAEFSIADLALASYMARLPRDWRPAQLGFARLAGWERAVMLRPSVREQMGPAPALAG
jgi:glutathione S-transferase